MINAVPKSIFSWDFEVFDEFGMLAIIDVRWLKEGGSFDYQGKTYDLRKDGLFSTRFSMEEDGVGIAQAEKTPMIRAFDVAFEGRIYKLNAVSPFSRKFNVSYDGIRIGRISPRSFFGRTCDVDISDQVPVPVQMFMLWLVIIMWRRTRNSNAATSS